MTNNHDATWVSELIFLEVESLATAGAEILLLVGCKPSADFRVSLFAGLLQCLETAHVFWLLAISCVLAAHSRASLSVGSQEMSAPFF